MLPRLDQRVRVTVLVAGRPVEIAGRIAELHPHHVVIESRAPQRVEGVGVAKWRVLASYDGYQLEEEPQDQTWMGRS